MFYIFSYIFSVLTAEPRTRPKLVLAPRTKPLESPVPETAEPVSAAKPAPVTVPAASIFGSAKPVDTSARERQIEERLAKQTEQVNENSNTDSRRESRWDDDRSGKRRVSIFYILLLFNTCFISNTVEPLF